MANRIRFCSKELLAWACVFLTLTGLISCGTQHDATRLEAEVQEALEALKTFDYAKTEHLLQKNVSHLDKASPLRVEAHYALALSKWHRTPPKREATEQARSILVSLLKEPLDPQLKGQLQLDIARIDEVVDYPGDQPRIDDARVVYRELMQTHRDDIGFQAAMRLANSYAKHADTQGLEEAVRILNSYLKDCPDLPEWKSMAYMYLGRLYGGPLNKPGEALDVLQKAHQLGFITTSREDESLWRMAQWAEKAGRQNESLPYYRIIIKEKPRSQFQTLARIRYEAISGQTIDPGP
ncbi:MAG: tetratricopeptide repeat protein [Candidatus Methylacidiphilales bacterium]